MSSCKCGCEHLESASTKDIRIVVLQRGWVLIGEFNQEGHKCWLEKASVIRNWGTTKGLGELVDGPTSKTILDPCGRVEFHELTIVLTSKVNASKWSLK